MRLKLYLHTVSDYMTVIQQVRIGIWSNLTHKTAVWLTSGNRHWRLSLKVYTFGYRKWGTKWLITTWNICIFSAQCSRHGGAYTRLLLLCAGLCAFNDNVCICKMVAMYILDPSITWSTTHDVLTEDKLAKTIDSDLLWFLELFCNKLTSSVNSLDTEKKNPQHTVSLNISSRMFLLE